MSLAKKKKNLKKTKLKAPLLQLGASGSEQGTVPWLGTCRRSHALRRQVPGWAARRAAPEPGRDEISVSAPRTSTGRSLHHSDLRASGTIPEADASAVPRLHEGAMDGGRARLLSKAGHRAKRINDLLKKKEGPRQLAQ